jgi:hypothetical protein
MPIKAVRSVKFPALIKTTGAITLEKSGSEFTFDFDPLQCIPYDLADALPYAAGIVCNKAPKATVVTQNGFTYAFSGTNGYVTPSIFDATQWDIVAAPGVFADTERAEAAADAAEASAIAAADASRLNLVSSVLTAGATPTASISGPSGAQVLTLGLAPGATGSTGPIGAFGFDRTYPTTAAALSNGVAGLTGLVGGSSGTNGTFALAFSGGGGADAVGYFIVSGGAVVQAVITFPGYNYTSAPTVSFAASSGLTGASATAVLRQNVPTNGYFSITADTVGNALAVYQNVAGVATFVKFVQSTETIDASYTDISGYAYALTDQDGRIGLAIEASGNVLMPATPKFESIEDTPTSMSGVSYALTDQDGRIGFGLETNGNVIHKGVRGIDLANFGTIVADLEGALDPTAIIDCLGDSLTHGTTAGVTVPFPTALATALPGRTINNRGITGRTSLQIATAFGAVPSILTITSNTMPASGSVSVTATENGNFGSKANLGGFNILGSLDGTAGTLAVAYNAGDPNLAGTSTFTRAVSGTSRLIPNRTPFIPTTNGWENNTVVIWSGRNDIISGFTNDVILANIAAMVAFLAPLRKRFVILSVIDQSSEANGSAAHTQILALNYELSKLYPRNFLDIRKILVNSYNSGSGPDVTAFGNDKVPPSLQIDGLHLNDAGYAIVATAVANFITAKGW